MAKANNKNILKSFFGTGEVLVRSTDNVKNNGEVYTPSHMVKQMCDELNDIILDISKTIIEPACGSGNFLVELLERRLDAIFTYSQDVFTDILITFSTLYGIDILPDNVVTCKKRLVSLLSEKYFSKYNQNIPDIYMKAVQILLDKNIVCGNTLVASKVERSDSAKVTIYKWFISANSISYETYDFSDLDILLVKSADYTLEEFVKDVI